MESKLYRSPRSTTSEVYDDDDDDYDEEDEEDNVLFGSRKRNVNNKENQNLLRRIFHRKRDAQFRLVSRTKPHQFNIARRGVWHYRMCFVCTVMCFVYSNVFCM